MGKGMFLEFPPIQNLTNLTCFSWLIVYTNLFLLSYFKVQVTWTPSSAFGCHATTMTVWWKTLRKRAKKTRDDVTFNTQYVVNTQAFIGLFFPKELFNKFGPSCK